LNGGISGRYVVAVSGRIWAVGWACGAGEITGVEVASGWWTWANGSGVAWRSERWATL